MYRDKRLEGFDAAAVVEVVEHLETPRLSAFERILFEFAHPRFVVLTTPNRDYNVAWETLPAGEFRHPDHRFEWTREEFQQWSTRVGELYGYAVRLLAEFPLLDRPLDTGDWAFASFSDDDSVIAVIEPYSVTFFGT